MPQSTLYNCGCKSSSRPRSYAKVANGSTLQWSTGGAHHSFICLAPWWVNNKWPLRCQTHGYLPSSRVSLCLGQITWRLGRQHRNVNNLPRVTMQLCSTVSWSRDQSTTSSQVWRPTCCIAEEGPQSQQSSVPCKRLQFCVDASMPQAKASERRANFSRWTYSD